MRGFLLFALILCRVFPVAGQKSVQSDAALKQQLQALSERSLGTLGVSALCIETGARAGIRGGEPFPMMSTYKLPIGICFLSQVHTGAHRLDDTVRITAESFSPGHSPLAQWVIGQGGTAFISKKELLTRMVSESDNTACDILLNLMGGPATVNKYLKKVGTVGMRVDRFERQLNADALGIKQLPAGWSLTAFDSLAEHVPQAERQAAIRRAMNDIRDSTVPDAMVVLLERLHARMLPDFSHYNLLLTIMTETQTGLKRIKALLPAGTMVAHKTGTQYTVDGINGGTNDVGIITSPDGKRHILLAVYLKGSTLDGDGREQIIARVAEAVYAAFTK